MVQGGKLTDRHMRPDGKVKVKGTATTKRKSAPTEARTCSDPISKSTHSVTAAINRRIEELMAGRLAHQGGTLAVIPKPSNVEKYLSGGARESEKRAKQLEKDSFNRRSRQKRKYGALLERSMPTQSEVAKAAANRIIVKASQKLSAQANGAKLNPDAPTPIDSLHYEPFDESNPDPGASWVSDDEDDDEEDGDESDASDEDETKSSTDKSPATPATASASASKSSSTASTSAKTQPKTTSNSTSRPIASTTRTAHSQASASTARASTTPAKKSSNQKAAAVAANDDDNDDDNDDESDNGEQAEKRGRGLLGSWFAKRKEKQAL